MTGAVISLGSIVVYKMCMMSTPKKALNPQSKEMGTKKAVSPYALQTIVRQDEVDHAQPDPLNLTSNKKHLNHLKTEIGPHGVPRRIYQGPGGSRINTYGSNYDCL